MATLVIIPGGFHPFHAGHLALIQSAQRAFPDAEVYVAATNDTSARPFPFSVKEKLAKLAGVESGHFIQVKSPFRAEEITSRFDPKTDNLIFVRSEKDADKPPQAGGVKRDGSAAYLQPLLGAKKLESFSKHAYMAYLPTVEFGPGMTSATEIRTAWPTLNEKRKTALVMSLYPRTQSNLKLANTVVKLLDAAIGTQDVAENFADGRNPQDKGDSKRHGINTKASVSSLRKTAKQGGRKGQLAHWLANMKAGRAKKEDIEEELQHNPVDENQGWAATLEDQDYIEEKWSQKYKSSINCANPQGFSQKAHCAGRKK